MTKRTILVVASSVVFITTLLVWFFRPHRTPAPALVEPRLLALREPYRAVQSFYYMDGGSVGIRITDADGRTEEFAIPSHLGSQERYQRVFVGAIYDERPGATEVTHSLETKQALVVILSRYSHGDPQLDAATMHLSGRFADVYRVLIHRLFGHYRMP